MLANIRTLSMKKLKKLGDQCNVVFALWCYGYQLHRGLVRVAGGHKEMSSILADQ
jgi:hypothetical protein